MRKICICISLLTLLGLHSFAQSSLEDCKSKARDNYPLIAQYDLIALTQEYTLDMAAKAWLPQVSISGQATYQSDVMKWPEQFDAIFAMQGIEMEGLRKDQYKVQIDVRQTIWDGGKSKADTQIAELESTQSRLSTDVDMYAVDKRVEELYFGILIIQEQQYLLSDMKRCLENNLDHIMVLVENGVATQADADEIKVQILKTNQNIVQVKSKETAFRRMLGLFIGEDLENKELAIPSSVEPLDKTSLRPELNLFDAQINLLQAQNDMLNVSLTPKFGLFAQGYYGYPGLDMFASMASPKWSLNGVIGVQMTWNISNFYTIKDSRRRINNSINQINMTRDIFLFNNNLQKEQESAEIQQIREILEYDDDIVSLLTRVRVAAEAKLQEGIIDTYSLLNKISEETAAKIARTTHEIELTKAIYDLKHTLNR